MPLLYGFDIFFGRKNGGAVGPRENAQDNSPLAALLGERLAASQPGERAEACRHLMAMLKTSARQMPGSADGDDRPTLDVCAGVINDLSRSLDQGRLAFHTEPALIAYVERATQNRLKQMARAQTAALADADSVLDPPTPDGPIPRIMPPKPSAPPQGAERTAESTGAAGAAREPGGAGGSGGSPDVPSPTTDRTERLIEQVQRLQPQLDALAETTRRGTRLVETVGEHLRLAESRAGALDVTLGRMSEESGRQTQLLETIQRHLEANGQTTSRLHESLGGVRAALQQLAATNTRAHEVLSELASPLPERPHAEPARPAGTSRWVLAALALSGAISLAALIVAALALK